MKGKQHVYVASNKIKYDITLNRNITIIKGEYKMKVSQI